VVGDSGGALDLLRCTYPSVPVLTSQVTQYCVS
jgi:hypothetical protein